MRKRIGKRTRIKVLGASALLAVVVVVATVVAASGEPGATGSTEAAGFGSTYYISPVAIVLLAVYGASFALYKSRRMRIRTHRKIWNLLLLGSFLVTGVSGLLLAINLTHGLPFQLPFSLLFWHVETGAAMTLISFFHVGWHFNYYAALIRGRSSVWDGRVAPTPRGVAPRQTTTYRTQRSRYQGGSR